MTFSFNYKFPGKVNPGDDIAVFFRLFDETGTIFWASITSRRFGQRRFGNDGLQDGDVPSLRAEKNATGIWLPKGAQAVTADVWGGVQHFQFVDVRRRAI